MITFLRQAHFQYMKHAISIRCLANPIEFIAAFLIHSRTHIKILFIIKVKKKQIMVINQSCASPPSPLPPPPPPPIMLTIEHRMVIIFCTCNPLSCKHMSFQHLFLWPHQPHITQTCLLENAQLQTFKFLFLFLFLFYYKFFIRKKTLTKGKRPASIGRCRMLGLIRHITE